jgi:hypothetical protein
MVKLGVFLAVLATLALPVPASARVLSALDVLTVCLTTPKNPLDVLVYFHANGWSEISIADSVKLRDQVAMTLFAAQSQGHTEALKDKAYWAEIQVSASKLMEPAPDMAHVVLHHAETGAILILSTQKQPKVRLSCNLSIPSKAMMTQEFHPKLPVPTPPALFETSIDGFNLDHLSRVTIITTTTAISQPSVDTALDIHTDITASFYTSISYPAWAVSP